MPSPLPGMNPSIEQPELWSELHSRMIVAIADSLEGLLNRDYRVAVKKRVYLSQDDEQVLIGIPDVAVVTASTNSLQDSNRSTVAIAKPQTLELPQREEVQERYLEIREGATGAVVTTLELLSPKNKRTGEGRDAYLRKRQQVLTSRTNYDRARFELAIDYNQTLSPQLSESEQTWVLDCIQDQKRS
ncbi:MAG: DUF4058 family protein [Cyanobacteria bacterium P01_A01_bin.137]